jgi:REP element-mobilizing transposase RayT
MTYDPRIHHRRSIRLRGHDYSGGGAYFVTVCIQGKASLFGQVVENEMVLSEPGRIVEGAWRALPARFPSVVLDVHQVMPNHLHGIVVIPGPGLEPSLATATGAPIIQPFVGPGLAPAKAKASLGPTVRRVGLGAVVRCFKSLSAIAVNQALARTGRCLWQEDYYEHIIRNVEELEKTCDYIIHNPARWLEDPENPDVGPGLAPASATPRGERLIWPKA